MSAVTVAAFYKFFHLPDLACRRRSLHDACLAAGVSGTILLAEEGINGTIAGPSPGIDAVLGRLRALPGCTDFDVKLSSAEVNPFYRMKVRIKKEIVSMGVPEVDAAISAGTYVEPQDWNDLIGDRDVVVIDTRNDYEVAIGSFAGALNPQTASFRDFPDWLRNRRETLKDARLAMFCTGGIRCEKATALARNLGFSDVFHLKGGILNYLDKVPGPRSLWHGECFVFDQRVSVSHGLAPGSYELCHACRTPLSEADRRSPDYRTGVSCPHCRNLRSDDQRRRYRERQHQIERAEARGAEHLGTAAQPERRR